MLKLNPGMKLTVTQRNRSKRVVCTAWFIVHSVVAYAQTCVLFYDVEGFLRVADYNEISILA